MKKISQPKTTSLFQISELETMLLIKVIGYYLQEEKGSPEHDYILANIRNELNKS